MIKKLSTYIFLIFFTTSITAEEIIMKCKVQKYKYIIQDSGNIILGTHLKRDKGKWYKWCPYQVQDDNKHFLISVDGAKLSISNLKGVCMAEGGKFKLTGGGTGTVKSQTSVMDFNKFTRTSEFFWMDETQKRKTKEKCKKVKK